MRRTAVGMAALTAILAAACTTPSDANSSPDTAASPPDRVPENLHVVSISALGPDTFWVLGQGPEPTLLRTDDGGDSFTVLSVPDAPFAGHYLVDTISDVRFADEDNGWLYGDGLWSTHDGGETWSRVQMDGPMDRHVSWLEVDDGHAFAIAYPDRPSVWRSLSPPDTWERLDVDFRFLDGPEGLAVAGDLVAISAGDGTTTTGLFVSEDGGETFTERPTTCTPWGSAGLLSVVDGTIWLTCPTGHQTSPIWNVLVSTDAGRTWDEVYAHDSDRNAGPSVGARTATTATLVAQGKSEIVHVDATNVGRPSRVNVAGLSSPEYIGFTTSDVGYIIDAGTGQLLRTTDGGSTWTTIEFS